MNREWSKGGIPGNSEGSLNNEWGLLGEHKWEAYPRRSQKYESPEGGNSVDLWN